MKAEIVSEIIEVEAQAGTNTVVRHGLGRLVGGWLVVWQDAPGAFYVVDATADSSKELVLVPTASFRARIVLLS